MFYHTFILVCLLCLHQVLQFVNDLYDKCTCLVQILCWIPWQPPSHPIQHTCTHTHVRWLTRTHTHTHKPNTHSISTICSESYQHNLYEIGLYGGNIFFGYHNFYLYIFNAIDRFQFEFSQQKIYFYVHEHETLIFSYTQRKKQTMFYDKIWLFPRIQVHALGTCFSIYLPLNQTTSCQNKLFQKKCNILESYNRSCRVRIEIKHRYPYFIAE